MAAGAKVKTSAPSDAKKPAKKAEKKATKKDAPKAGPKQAQQSQKKKEGGASVPSAKEGEKTKKNKKSKANAITKAVATGDAAKTAVVNKQQQKKKGEQQKKKGEQQKQKPNAASTVADFKSLQITVSNNVPAAVRFGGGPIRGGMGGGPMRTGLNRGPMRGGMQGGGQVRKQLMNQKRGLGGGSQGGVRKIALQK